MEKIELQKKLEKQKAYLICTMIFLGLLTPTFLSMTSRLGISISLQASFFFVILCAIGTLYYKVLKIETKLNRLPR